MLFVRGMICVIVSLMTQWVFNRGVEEQMKAFLDGFSEVLPLQWLQYFDERELEVRSFMLLMISDKAAIVVSAVCTSSWICHIFL